MSTVNYYQIGVTEANMQNLVNLGLPDPLWEPLSDFTPWSDLKLRGDGTLAGLGLPTIKWRFNELTLREFGIFLYYVTTDAALVASKIVWVRTRIPSSNMTARVFRTYKAVMVCPMEPRDLRYIQARRYQNVEITFINCELQDELPLDL